MAKAAGLFCTLLLVAWFCCQSQAQRGTAVPTKCCFTFQTRKIRRDNVVSSYVTSTMCPHLAVVFKTKGGQEICAKLDKPWVKEYQDFLASKV
ncbi:C-C motif chemokine 4-like [Carettochelys insculpta]|uniref:C-C motif chemokine 4-like n=1 Tax=Carettochelys insculpta TaxID=44489 RepID=UPI003EB8E0C4